MLIQAKLSSLLGKGEFTERPKYDTIHPMRKPTSTKRVLIACQHASLHSRIQKMNGIYQHIAKGAAWDLLLPHDTDEITPAYLQRKIEQGIDGIIVTGNHSADVISFLALITIPTATIYVDLNRTQNLVRIETDEQDVAKMAADYLLSFGRFRAFGMVDTAAESPGADAGHTFCDLMKAKGFAVRTIRDDANADSARLTEWLKSLPLPSAVLVRDSYLGEKVLRACKVCGLHVPEQITVLAADNKPTVCDHTSPTLSGIELDYVRQGRLAAELLDRLMSSRKNRMSVETRRVGALEIVERHSTPVIPSAGKMVQNAIRFITANATCGIRVPDVAKHLRCSRRLLDLRFREIRDETVLEAILEAKLSATANALADTSRSISQVCYDCGWKSETRPKVLFKQRFGMSMRDYRSASPLNTSFVNCRLPRQ